MAKVCRACVGLLIYGGNYLFGIWVGLVMQKTPLNAKVIDRLTVRLTKTVERMNGWAVLAKKLQTILSYFLPFPLKMADPLPWRDSAVRLTNSLVNIRAIINHFSPKIDSWAVANHLSSLDEQQVR